MTEAARRGALEVVNWSGPLGGACLAELREVVVLGAVPALPLAACLLARRRHAPNLWSIVGGSGTVNPEPEALPASSCDPALARAPSALPLTEVVLLEGRGDALDVFCAGGLQIDAHGNCNLICVGPWDRPTLRGPGTVGLPFLPAVRRSVLYTMNHTRGRSWSGWTS